MKSRNLLTKNLKPDYQEIEWFLKRANENQKEILLANFTKLVSGETLYNMYNIGDKIQITKG